MPKPSTTIHVTTRYDWATYLSITILLPLLTLYTLYLSGNFLAACRLLPTPDFWSQSMLKTNLICFGPALILMSVMCNLELYYPQRNRYKYERYAIASIAWLTLVLVVAANTLLLVLHFSFFSTDRYIRCWEPFPWGNWYYARTAEICKQHGLAPVQMLNSRSNAKSAATP